MVEIACFMVEYPLKCTVLSTNLKSATGSNLKSAIFKNTIFQKGNEDMKRYWDVDREIIVTEDEVRASYEAYKSEDETYEEYLNGCMFRNNGSLEPINEDPIWYMHTSWDGLKRIESTEMQDDFGSDAVRVYMIGKTSFGFRFVSEDGAIYEADADDLQVIDWDNWE